MSGHAVFRCGLLLAACVLAGTGAAEAKIAQSLPARTVIPNVLGQDGLGDYYNRNPDAGQGEVTKTITLNFGPLHFQEVFRTKPKTCRS